MAQNKILPSDDEIDARAILICKEEFPDQTDITLETEIYSYGAEWMRFEAHKLIATQQSEMERLKAELEEVRGALRKYAVHKETCDLTYGTGNTNSCTCGLLNTRI